MGDLITVSGPGYREGTQLKRQRICFVYNAGGIGDYIYWTQAIRHAIESQPHIYGYISAPGFFVDLARLWLGDLRDRFKVKEHVKWETEEWTKSTPCVVPDGRQYANALGFHLHQLGFIYYSQINYIPKGYEHPPEIRGDEFHVEHPLPEDYAVITPYATHDNRRMSAEAINDLTTYVLGRGLTPVFLGKAYMAPDHKAKTSEAINLEGVIDLTEKTSLREAAVIMARAKAVIGLDNGLLHLACCSRVPVVFAFTTVEPRLRLPKRREGAKTITLTPPKELGCRFCSSHGRFVIGHDYADCLYRDNLCTKLITGPDLIRAYEELMK